MTYVEKTAYFEFKPPGHSIAYKNIDDLVDVLICYIASKYDA